MPTRLACRLTAAALLSSLPMVALAETTAPFDFSGPSLGFFLGASKSNTLATDISGEEFGESAFGGFSDYVPGGQESLSGNGGYVGVSAAYTLQSGALVYGGEFELGRLAVDDLQVRDGDDGVYTKMSQFLALTARIGYARDRTLFYAKAGPAWAKIRNAGGEFDGFGDEDSDGYWGFDGNEAGFGEGTRNGYLLGLGFEHVLSSGLSFVAEYNYADFGSVTLGHVDGDMSEPFSFENELHLVKLGLSYRF